VKEGTTLADLLGRRRLGDVRREIADMPRVMTQSLFYRENLMPGWCLSVAGPAAGRRRRLHDVGTEGSLGDAERIRPKSGCLGDRLDRHEPVGGDASAKRRSPQGGSNKPSFMRRGAPVVHCAHPAFRTRLTTLATRLVF